MAVDGMAISLSGLQAASQRIATSANNIANQQSAARVGEGGQLENKPYVPQDTVQLSNDAAGGVRVQTQDRSPASVASYRPDSPLADASGLVNTPNVDPVVEQVNQQIAVYDFKANLKALKVQDEMQREVLNIVT